MATVAQARPLRRGAMNQQGALYDFLFNVKELLNAVTGASMSLEAGSAPSATLAATAAELSRGSDVSERLVNLNATSLAIAEATHENRIVKLSHTAATSTVTLPAATGSGARYGFVVGAVNTNNHVIKVTTDDVMKGVVSILDNDSNALTAYSASGTDDTLTLNGTTTGGQIGDWVEFVDIAADTWHVRGQLVCPAGSNVADMFSATVS